METTTPIPTAPIRPMECLKEGWELIKPVYWLFFGITIVGMLIGGALPIILMGPMTVGIYICLLKRENGETVEFGDLFKGFDQFADGLVANLLITGISIVCGAAALIVSFILFFIAGAMPGGAIQAIMALGAWALMYVFLLAVSLAIGVAMFFVFQLIAEKKLKAVEAVKLSVATARQNLMGLLLLMLLMMGVGIVGSLACCVGVYFVQPVLFATSFVAYRKLFPRTAGAQQ